MPSLLVDNREIPIEPAARLNCIQAAKLAGVEIPHYCWHPGLSVVASCRMCLVETGTRDPATGQITMIPKLVPGCQTPAKDGTVIVTNSDKVRAARAMVEEDLLIDHPIDCPICDKAGECTLQDYHFQHGQKERRADIRPFTSRRRELGETVTLFVDRCVMCSRCVRFTREISGTSELMVTHRGSHEEIDVFPGYPLDNKLSGNVVDLCPVGALGDKDFLYQQRVWFLEKSPGVCTGCSTGCSISVEQNQDQLFRLKPRENPHINQWWMCDEGRYGFHHVHSSLRITEPTRVVDGSSPVAVEWSDVGRELPIALRKAGRLAAVLSPHLTVEEAWLLATFIRGLDSSALIVAGPVGALGTDERFMNGFTIRAEKAPNRRGVLAIIRHFGGDGLLWEEFLPRAERGDVQGAWFSGGYKSDWIDAATADRFALEIMVVQDMFSSPLWERATWRLPGASFAEREGCYVNFADRIQYAPWAIRPPEGVRVEGGLYWELLQRRGMFDAQSVLAEVAREIPYFSAAAQGVGEYGIDLKVNQLVKDTTQEKAEISG